MAQPDAEAALTAIREKLRTAEADSAARYFERTAAERRRDRAERGHKPRGWPHSPATRAKIGARTFERHVARMEADPATSALRRARIARGWSMVRLAERAGLGRTTVFLAETRQPTSDKTWQHLAFALDGTVETWRKWRDAD